MPQRQIPRHAFQLAAPLQLQDTEVGSGGEGAREWSGVAYTGEPLRLFPMDDERLVIDLESMQGLDRRLPVLIGHDRDRIAGYAERLQADDSLKVSGRLLQSTEHGRTVAEASDEGFPWQLSIDARPSRIEEIESGTEVTVNGRQLTGPLIIFRDTRVAEVSFTPTGVDYGTTAAALSDDPVTVQTTALEDNTMAGNQQQTQQGQGTGQEPTVAQLQQQLAEEQQARQQAEQQLAEERRERRKGEVRTLFAEIGREYTEEAAEPYVQMADETFKAVAQDLRQHAGKGQQQGTQRPTPPDSATLQSEQAQGEPDSQQLNDDEVIDALAQL